MQDILRKLTSRKLWIAIAGVTTGIAVALGADSNEISQVIGSVTALISAITYIITEGKVDAARVSTSVVEVTKDESEN